MFTLIRRLFSICIILAVLFYSKNFIAKVAIAKGFQAATGLSTKVSKADLSIDKTDVEAQGLTVLSPSGFSDEAMFSIHDAYVDYDLKSLFKGNFHFEEIRLDLDSVTVVRNEEGEFNIAALRSNQRNTGYETDDDTGHTPGSSRQDEVKKDKLNIAHLLLRVERVIYKDYTHSDFPLVREYDVDIYEKFENISSAEELIATVVQKSITKTALARITNFKNERFEKSIASGNERSFRDRVNNIADRLFSNR